MSIKTGKIDTKDFLVDPHPNVGQELPPRLRPRQARSAVKRVRVIKKARLSGGIWRSVSLDRIGSCHV